MSKNACLENLILRAQQDSEQLLEDAQNDASLFDISNQLVYGGAYGPCYKSGDSVGCGILQTAPGEVCIYFTINGLRLPGIRMKSTGFNYYPVVSMKGKLCHFEVVKSVKQFHHNQTMYHEDQHRNLVAQIRNTEKFMRSLQQFNQILTLKSRRNNDETERSRTPTGRRKGMKNAPENLIRILNKEEISAIEVLKQVPRLQGAKSQKNLEVPQRPTKTSPPLQQTFLTKPGLHLPPKNASYQQSLQSVQSMARAFKPGGPTSVNSHSGTESVSHKSKNFVKQNKMKISKSQSKF